MDPTNGIFKVLLRWGVTSFSRLHPRRPRLISTLLASVYAVLVLLSAASPSRAEKLFVNVPFINEVHRYEVGPTGTPALEVVISHPSLDVPVGIAFSPTGEMFIVNSAVSGLGNGSVSRFLNPAGTPVFNGTIASPNFGTPHWAVFRMGELFIVNPFGNNVLRFIFDPAGNAMPNGAITAGLESTGARVRGVQVAPWGELFVTVCCEFNQIRRYLIDASGNAIPNGVITGMDNPHDMVFSPWGELFVGNTGNYPPRQPPAGPNSISRFIFDAAGNVTPNGQITGSTLNGPAGLAFSPWGELFVSNAFGEGRISRWMFDSSFNAVFNGSFPAADGVGEIAFLVPLTVDIDIKPGSFPNSINPQSRGVIPVAILSTDTFDGTTIDPITVRFGATETEAAPVHSALEDVDHDGDPDMILHFNTQNTGIVCGNTSAFLIGQTVSGQAIQGSDSLNTVGCK